MNHDNASDHKPHQGLQPDAPPGADPGEGKPHPEYRIDIYRDWCKGCGICAAFCPRQCLGLDAEGHPVVEKSERCTGCRWCELHCPDFAICVREVEKASEDAPKP
jgi:2-oxoglutarate ferredoxin oxidoreductase subunit delta